MHSKSEKRLALALAVLAALLALAAGALFLIAPLWMPMPRAAEYHPAFAQTAQADETEQEEASWTK